MKNLKLMVLLIIMSIITIGCYDKNDTNILSILDQDFKFNERVIGRLNQIFQESGKKNYSICQQSGANFTKKFFVESEYQNMKPWVVSSVLRYNANYMVSLDLESIKRKFGRLIFYLFPMNDLNPRPEVLKTGAWLTSEEGISLDEDSKDLDKFLCNRLQDESPYYINVTRLGSEFIGGSDFTVTIDRTRVAYRFINSFIEDWFAKKVIGIGRTLPVKAAVAKRKLPNGKNKVLIFFHGDPPKRFI